jgi:3-phenylpropionate/trans-cinnamate dioxygenase ferredoxin reductase subunit
MSACALDERVVVVGAGQAGGELVARLRAGGYVGEIVLIGTEPHLPYSRPPLSKTFLRGEAQVEELFLRSARFYEEQGITVLAGATVRSIDLHAKTLECDEGTSLAWDKLVLATGGRPRRLPDPALNDASNVHYLRTIDDVARLRAGTRPGTRFAVVGGGYVGLEVTSVLRRLGAEVTVIEAADRLLARVTSPPVSDFFRQLHEEEGVDVRLASQVESYEYVDGDVAALRLSDGSMIEVDQVLIGIGMIPNDDLARAAGLTVDNGIVVDEYCRAGSDVYAIGDVSRHPDPQNGGFRRLESMPNAAAQARHAADDILGTPAPYVDVPWFWSDQYDVKLQCAGLNTGYDEIVVRGDITVGRQFTAFYLKDGRVCAVDSVGRPAEYAAGKALIAGAAPADRQALADQSIPLRASRRSRELTGVTR